MAWFNPFSWFIGGRAFAETTDPGIDRANVRFLIPPDSRLYIKQWSRRQLNHKAEWLFQNFGVVKDGIRGIARHTTGKGISLQIDSEDSKWNELAEHDFEEYALTPERCDISGRRNFYEMQAFAVEQRLIRGEFFMALCENAEWDKTPAFQIYDSEEVGTLMPQWDFGDKVVYDGIELDKNARAIAYWVRGPDNNYFPIPRGRMVHWFKPHAVNQPRGWTELAQAVNPLVDIYELKRIAVRSAKAQLLLALFMKNVGKKKQRGALGAIQNAGQNADGTPVPDTAQLEQVMGAAGGGIFYGEGDSDVKLVTSNSPSPLVEAFITDLLMRDVCAGWGVPSEFFWNIAKLSGANTRFVLARADLFFQILGEGLVDRVCTPIAFRYLSDRIQKGLLRECKDKDWASKLSWQLPPRVTVDNGRENQILIELLANGMMTLREYCNARGINYKAVMRQWIREPIQFIQIAEDEGASPDYLARLRENLPIWRAPKPGAVFAPPDADPAAKGSAEVADTDQQTAGLDEQS